MATEYAPLDPLIREYQGDIRDGLRELSQRQTVIFSLYDQAIIHGYTFYVRNTDAEPLTVEGSIHVSVNQEMRETENIAVTSVIFSATQPIESFLEVGSTSLWLANFLIDDASIQFSFNRQGAFYDNSGEYHYIGDAVYPVFKRLFVESADDLTGIKPLTSNSLVYWLSFDFGLPLYPSYLAPTNLTEPYGVLRLYNEITTSSGRINDGHRESSRFDDVELTIYNLDSDEIGDLIYNIDNVIEASDEEFSLAFRIEIADVGDYTQSETNTIAIKTVLKTKASYTLRTKLTNYQEKAVQSFFIENWQYLPFALESNQGFINAPTGEKQIASNHPQTTFTQG